MTCGFSLEARPRLDPQDLPALVALIDRITEHDGMRPLSEHVWLHLKGGGDDRGQHVVARAEDGTFVGYAHLDVTDEVEGPSAELAVDPRERRHAWPRCTPRLGPSRHASR